MVRKKKQAEESDSTATLSAPPPNTPEPINWRRAKKSFDRLLRVRGDDFKELSDLRTYKSNGYDV